MSTPATTEHPAVVKKLSALDRLLPVWIGVAMVAVVKAAPVTAAEAATAGATDTKAKTSEGAAS